MKLKKQVKIIMSILLLLIIILVSCIIFNNNKNNTNFKDEKEKENQDAIKNSAFKMYAEEIDEKQTDEDGWYYYFLISTIDKEQKKTSNFFDGCNLKYNQLEDYKFVIYKDETLTEKVKEYYTYPTLSVSQKSNNGVLAGQEIRTIDDWFDKKQFQENIDITDMKDLNIYNYDKNAILNIFNKSQSKKFNKNQGPFLMNVCSIKQDNLDENYQWNIGIIAYNGVIYALRIDILYADKNFLSDLVKENKASQEQKELYESFSVLEKYIVENQKIDLKETFSNYNNSYYDRLYKLVDTFDDGWE